MNIRILFLAFFVATFSLLGMSCQQTTQEGTEKLSTQAPTTIFLVRHAEKESGDNPALTAAGNNRAQALAKLLQNVKLAAVYSTDYQRTQSTAAPTAQQHGLSVQSYDPRNLPAMVTTVSEKHAGETILIVGHSNTTPTLTGLLDGTEAHAPFDESDYGNIMMVTLPAHGPSSTLQLRY